MISTPECCADRPERLFAGTKLLVNRLIELGKRRRDSMVYPGRTHSISEGKGTTLHIYSALARYLEEHLWARPC